MEAKFKIYNIYRYYYFYVNSECIKKTIDNELQNINIDDPHR